MNDKRRYTITGTHFVENQPVRELVTEAPNNPIPEGRAYIRRMGWNHCPGLRSATTSAELAASIRDTALDGAVFFPDTCFLRAPLDETVWQSLLTRKVAIAPWVERELNSWAASPGSSAGQVELLRRRFADAGQRVAVVTAGQDYDNHGYKYYCPLLLVRKLQGKRFALEFERKTGRAPTKSEFFSGYKKIRPGYTDRAVRIAWKGAADYEKDNYAADEQLVTMAVLHALMTGHETTILTRDHDLMDQFYKLVFLIDTHYRSMLFAERYAANPSSYSPRSKRMIVQGRPDLFDDRFVGEDDVFMRPNLPPDEMWNDLLPESEGFVNVGCVWMGDGPYDLQVAEMVFCADKEMVNILKIKVETGGLNTNLLGGKNCHIWPCPDYQEALGACVAVATDKMIDFHESLPTLRALDMLHTTRCDEMFDRLEVEGASPDFPRAGPPA